jgi:GNAT superfamily N-acetyltransferase
LTAAQEEMEGEIRITLVNGWGVPIKVFNLNDIQVVIQDKARKPIDLVEKMTKETQLKIETIDDKSSHLQTVIELGDADKKTLGFFPEGAFREYAALRQIILAIESQSRCIGYLLYRYSSEHNRIAIIHLCVAPSERKKGVAKLLVNYLKEITQEYSGIGLRCRRDYKLDKFWSSLGFVAQSDIPAKTPGELLTNWRLDYGHPNLLSTLTNQQREFKLFVVIDTEIFFYLYTDEERKFAEAKSLLADWLQPYLEVCITDEVFNKINNENVENERNKMRKFAQNLTCLTCPNRRLDMIEQPLRKFFKEKNFLIDEYEVRNIARTLASDIYTYITCNSSLLDIAEDIYECFKLSILRPVELITRLDELRRKPEYQPVRLAGTQLEQTRLQKGQEAILNSYFQSFNQGESRAEFQQRLHRFLAEPDKFECSVVLEGENQPLALVVYDRHKKHELEIPMLRVGDNPLAATVTHHLIFQATLVSAREQRQFTRVTDTGLQETVIKVVQKDTFIKAENGWLRANIAVAETALNLSQRLESLAIKFGQEYVFCRQLANNLKTDGAITDTQTMLDIERFLCPAKIIDADIPTFIIPIKPFWAQQLFDEELANQTPFGATKIGLALNREAVYYKSRNAPKELKNAVGGRILWYVSKDKDDGYRGVSAIRACSRLDEVVIGKPDELYRRFRDLGIYERKHIFDTAHQDPNNVIMAIRFSDTELLKTPVTLHKIQEVFGQKMTIRTSLYISKENFAKVYALGVQT